MLMLCSQGAQGATAPLGLEVEHSTMPVLCGAATMLVSACLFVCCSAIRLLVCAFW